MHNPGCNQEHLMVSEQAGDMIRKAHNMDWNGGLKRQEEPLKSVSMFRQGGQREWTWEH